MILEPNDAVLPGTAAFAAVRLWVARDGVVAARLTTVDDLAAPVEQVYVTGDLDELQKRVRDWIAVTTTRLTK